MNKPAKTVESWEAAAKRAPLLLYPSNEFGELVRSRPCSRCGARCSALMWGKVELDRETKKPRGYGRVRFDDRNRPIGEQRYFYADAERYCALCTEALVEELREKERLEAERAREHTWKQAMYQQLFGHLV